LDFAEEDRLDTPRYNRALWTGMTGHAALPKPKRGDLSGDRPALLAKAGCP
ncbi:MAG: hypothetical protein JSR98_21020, partial [Proteobacteria bacterium]|nr:hypothetical protein [Pseudomonadota bacterium]